MNIGYLSQETRGLKDMVAEKRERAVIDLGKTETKFFYKKAVETLGTKNTFPEKSRTIEAALEFVAEIGEEIAQQYQSMSFIRKKLLFLQMIRDPKMKETILLEKKRIKSS